MSCRVLVVGGAGYIGSVMAAMLLDDGHEVAVLDSLERGHRKAIDPRAKFYEGNVRDRERVFQVCRQFRPGVAMHFSAYALVGESMEHPSMYFQNNFSAGLHLLDALVDVGSEMIVFSSTCAIFGQPERLPLTEDHPQAPANPYGESKWMFEKALLWYDRIYGLKHTSLRYFNAAGATETHGEDHDPETHLIPNVLKVALGQKEFVSVFGTDYPTPDGTCVRDYIHVEDLCRAHLLAMGLKQSNRYNLGNGRGFSVHEIVAAARQITGHALPVRNEPRRPGDPPGLVGSSEKIRNELGWKPQRPDIREIIQSAWEWHRKHPHGYGDE